MNKTLEKLSSGLRINRAGDDAAGLAISEKMRGQIRGLRMAIKNAQDAISMIQTAEGALNEIHAILQRMRELAVEAASDTNTDVDRSNLQKEVNQLLEEIDRIARATEFNTKKLFDGKIESFRTNSDVKVVTGGNIYLRVKEIEGEDIGMMTVVSYYYNAVANSDFGSTYRLDVDDDTDTYINVTLMSIGDNVVRYIVKSFTGMTLADSVVSSSGPLTVNLGDDLSLRMDFYSGLNTVDMYLTSSDYTADEGTYVVEVGQFLGAPTSDLDYRIIKSDENGESIIGEDLLRRGFHVEDGIVFRWDPFVFTVDDFGGSLPKEEVIDSAVARVEGMYTGSGYLTFQIGANEGQNMVFGIDKMDSKALGVMRETIDVTTQDTAERSIMAIDGAIHKVSEMRAQLGAFQNRLEYTIANLGVSAENLTAAESRIRDVDMVKEMMEFIRQQILIQSGMAMLAQANTLPQNVLQLLR